MIELRDLFAAVAMHAFLTQTNDKILAQSCIDSEKRAASYAYDQADQMLEMRGGGDRRGIFPAD